MDYTITHWKIIEECKQGNRQAQFDLYRLYSRAMYNVCLRIVKNEHDAEDILQESFIDVFTKLKSFKHKSSIGAWIKRIAINNSINFLKKKKIQLVEMHDNYSNIAHEDPVDEKVLNVENINDALKKLPDGYRVVFSLYLMEGYDHSEIASILDITESTSKSQYHRAKQKLKNILQDETRVFLQER